MTKPILRTPYLIPFFRSLSYRTRIEDEEELDRSAPPEYWERALNQRDYERFCRDPVALIPWLKKDKNT